MLGVVIKIHIDDKPLRSDIRRAFNNLRKTCETKQIGSIVIIKDLALIPLTRWTYFIEMCNEIFKGSEINVALLQNNIPIPCVEDRYKIIREYHETAIGGHRGMNKTYNKIANRNSSPKYVSGKFRSKFYYDKKLNTQHFRKGKMVKALKEPRKGKLDMYYVGPYEITSIDYAKNNVVIQRENKIKTVHIDKIKKASTVKTIPEEIT
jgi:hypothetical protein